MYKNSLIYKYIIFLIIYIYIIIFNIIGGAIYMSLFRDTPKVNFYNVTFNNNFSFSEGRDIYGNTYYLKLFYLHNNNNNNNNKKLKDVI